MRFVSEMTLFTSCALLCLAPVTVYSNNQPYTRRVSLTDNDEYFSFVNDQGALTLTHRDAETMCIKAGAQVWNINDGTELSSGKPRANQEIARQILENLRKKEEVKTQIEKDSILLRLNIVLGNREGLNDGECKWYLAGPYDKDFYAFTFYNECPEDTAPTSRSWFVCQKQKTTAGPDPKTTTKPSIPSTRTTVSRTTPTKDVTTPFEYMPVDTTTPSTATTEDSTFSENDQKVMREIDKLIKGENDARLLIEKVTAEIRNLDESFNGLKEFQEDFFESLDDLIGGDGRKAADATEDLFGKTVPTLAERLSSRQEYDSILGFVSEVTTRIAKFTKPATNISNSGSDSVVLYRLQNLELGGDPLYHSEVKTSTVRINYTGNLTKRSLLMTHMEFDNRVLKKKMIKATYNETRLFSSDLVKFFMTFDDGTPYYGTDVNLLFKRKTKQVKRAAEHDCVFYNMANRKLDYTGCEFIGVTDEGDIRCHCNHTTTFGSVFMPKSFDPEFEMILDVFSYSMDFLSLPSLLLSILIFGLVRQIRTVLTVIHLNLCVCLFASQLILVAHSIAYLFSDTWECGTALGMLIHYSFLTVIAWSTLEGVYILQLMIVVFKPPGSHTRYYLAFGYLLPVIFPVIAATFDKPYSTQSGQICFLDRDRSNGLYWTFLAPLLVMLCVNSIAISAVMYRLCTINRAVKTVKSELFRYLRGILCMTALLGLQWGLGFASVVFVGWNQAELKFTFIFLFVFFTLAQGPLIFVVHIMLVKDTRYAVARYLSKKGNFSRCVANFIRPPPPAAETNLHHGSTSTKSTEIASSNHSPSTPQTPLELNFVTTNPLGASNGNK